MWTKAENPQPVQVEEAKHGDFLGTINEKFQTHKKDLLIIREILMYLVCGAGPCH